jgi:hypothetical protein
MPLSVVPDFFTPTQFTGALGDAVGSAVHVDGKFAIVCVGENARPPQLLLASYDGKTFRLSTYAQQQVLLLGAGHDFIFEPDLTIASEYGASGPTPSSECYYDARGFYVPVFNAGNQWQMLHLNTAHLVLWPQDTRTHIFRRWRLGVRKGERVTWLLAVGDQLLPFASSRS